MLRGMYFSERNDTYGVLGGAYTITMLTNSDVSNGFRSEDVRRDVCLSFCSHWDQLEPWWPALLFSISFFSSGCFLSSKHQQYMVSDVSYVADNVSGHILDLSACGWTACPLAAKLGELLKIQTLPLFFFRFLYYLFLSILQCCFASTASDKHIFKGTPVKIFVKPSNRPANDDTEQ